MKIAICGKNSKSREDLIKQFISQWTMYASPAENIFNLERPWPEKTPPALDDIKDKLNDAEKYMFNKMLLLEEQQEKYKDEGYIIYNGYGNDIVVNCLILCEEGYLSDEFVEKIIYHNKKLMRGIDIIYWVPDDEINENSPEDDKKLESVYWNLYDNYQTDFANSPFFDQTNCPSIMMIDNKNPLAEIRMLLDSNGNLEGTSHGGDELIDTDKLKRVLKGNPKLLEAALESLKNPQSVGNNPFKGSIII